MWNRDRTTVRLYAAAAAMAFAGLSCAEGCDMNLEGHGAPIQMTEAVPSPDGTRVAFIAGHDYQDEEVFVWEPGTDKLTNITRSFGTQKTYARVVWAPDSRHVAIPMCGLPCREHSLSVFDVTTGDRRELASAPNIPELAFSSDGNHIAWATDHGSSDLWVVSTKGGPATKLTPTRQSAIQSLVFAQLRGRPGVFYVAGWLWGERNVYFAPLSGEGPEPLTKDGRYGRVALEGSQDILAYRAGENGGPPTQVFAVNLQTGEVRDTGRTGGSVEGRIPVLSMGGRTSIDHQGRSLASSRVKDAHRSERAAQARAEANQKEKLPWFPPNEGGMLVLSDASDARAGEPLDVTLTVKNPDGKYTSFNMRVELPEGFALLGGETKWSGTLAKGESHTLRAKVRVPDGRRAFINAYGSWSGRAKGSSWKGREWVFTEVDAGKEEPRRYRTYPTMEERSGASSLEVVDVRRIHRADVPREIHLGPHTLRILRIGAGPHLSGTRGPTSVGVRVEAHVDDEKVVTFGCTEEKDYGFQLRAGVLREETNPVSDGDHPQVEAGFRQDSVAVKSFSYDPDSYAWQWVDVAMLRYREDPSPITYKVEPLPDLPAPRPKGDPKELRVKKGQPIVVEGSVTASGGSDIVVGGLCAMITFEHSLSAVVKGGGHTFVWALRAIDTEDEHPHRTVTIPPESSHPFRIDLARALRKSDGAALSQVQGTYTAYISHRLGDHAVLEPAQVQVVIE